MQQVKRLRREAKGKPSLKWATQLFHLKMSEGFLMIFVVMQGGGRRRAIARQGRQRSMTAKRPKRRVHF